MRREQDGALVSRRMVHDEETRKKHAEAGRQGGNPVLVKQKPTPPVKQGPTPSSSSSSSDKRERENLPPNDLIGFGEFGMAKLTPEQHAKLLTRLNGNLETYIARFDRWVHEAPSAKVNGVKRSDRHAYESILSWFEKDVAEGKVKQKRPLAETPEYVG
jgi:hypothetical protein